jgi:hypothetical protein
VFDGPPVVDPAGNPYTVKITETSVTGSGVDVTAINYLGNGSTEDESTLPAIPASIDVTAGAGVNTVTFTNGSEG